MPKAMMTEEQIASKVQELIEIITGKIAPTIIEKVKVKQSSSTSGAACKANIAQTASPHLEKSKENDSDAFDAVEEGIPMIPLKKIVDFSGDEESVVKATSSNWEELVEPNTGFQLKPEQLVLSASELASVNTSVVLNNTTLSNPESTDFIKTSVPATKIKAIEFRLKKMVNLGDRIRVIELLLNSSDFKEWLDKNLMNELMTMQMEHGQVYGSGALNMIAEEDEIDKISAAQDDEQDLEGKLAVTDEDQGAKNAGINPHEKASQELEEINIDEHEDHDDASRLLLSKTPDSIILKQSYVPKSRLSYVQPERPSFRESFMSFLSPSGNVKKKNAYKNLHTSEEDQIASKICARLVCLHAQNVAMIKVNQWTGTGPCDADNLKMMMSIKLKIGSYMPMYAVENGDRAAFTGAILCAFATVCSGGILMPTYLALPLVYKLTKEASLFSEKYPQVCLDFAEILKNVLLNNGETASALSHFRTMSLASVLPSVVRDEIILSKDVIMSTVRELEKHDLRLALLEKMLDEEEAVCQLMNIHTGFNDPKRDMENKGTRKGIWDDIKLSMSGVIMEALQKAHISDELEASKAAAIDDGNDSWNLISHCEAAFAVDASLECVTNGAQNSVTQVPIDEIEPSEQERFEIMLNRLDPAPEIASQQSLALPKQVRIALYTHQIQQLIKELDLEIGKYKKFNVRSRTGAIKKIHEAIQSACNKLPVEGALVTLVNLYQAVNIIQEAAQLAHDGKMFHAKEKSGLSKHLSIALNKVFPCKKIQVNKGQKQQKDAVFADTGGSELRAAAAAQYR